MDELGTYGILAGLAFVPALLLVFWWRAQERVGREPVVSVLRTFAYGGTLGVVIALGLHVLLDFGFHHALGFDRLSAGILAAVVIAPLVEELAKALGMGLVRRDLDELEDGLIYGAALGLGFAATENFVYGTVALVEGGFGSALTVLALRVVSAMLLHLAASSLVGFGYGIAHLERSSWIRVLPFYLVAVLLHASYNYLVNTEALVGFVVALLMVYVVLHQLRRRIRQLDALPHDAKQPRPL